MPTVAFYMHSKVGLAFHEQTATQIHICLYGHFGFSLCRISVSDCTGFAKFVSNAENTYLKEGRALKFIPDLLKIHVPGLIDPAPGETYPSYGPVHLFKNSVRGFITINSLKEGVVEEIPAMLV